MKLKPLGDRLIVRRFEAEEKTAGGIVLPDTAKGKPQKGKVLAAGPGRLLKSGIRGVYHSVSAKWLQSYLDEYTWRYNHREHTERGTGERRVPIGEAKFRLLLARAATPN